MIISGANDYEFYYFFLYKLEQVNTSLENLTRNFKQNCCNRVPAYTNCCHDVNWKRRKRLDTTRNSELLRTLTYSAVL